MSILVVDDQARDREALEALLVERAGEPVLTAACAEEAFRLLGLDATGERFVAGKGEPRPEIELVLMDIDLPEIDGIEACRRIKAHPELSGVGVLMVTGFKDEAQIAQALAAGALDYFTKPLEPLILEARVRSALLIERQMEQLRERERELVATTRRLERANRRLHVLSTVDELTGLANRRFFDRRLAEEYDRCRREGKGLSLLMADLDGFKKYNDRYGHLKGDECLADVGRALQGTVRRPSDLVARYGGDEFSTILPGTDEPGALQIAEMQRRAVEDLGIEDGNAPCGFVTLSAGAAWRPPGSELSIEELLETADIALYQVKRQGRNGVSAAALRARVVNEPPARPSPPTA